MTTSLDRLARLRRDLRKEYTRMEVARDDRWHVEEYELGLSIESDSPRTLPYPKNGWGGPVENSHIASIHTGIIKLDVQRAEAKLLAAAPALRDALQALLDRIENITTEDFSRGMDRRERDAARAALALISRSASGGDKE